MVMHCPSLQVNSPSEQVVSFTCFTWCMCRIVWILASDDCQIYTIGSAQDVIWFTWRICQVIWTLVNDDCQMYIIGTAHDVSWVTRDCPTPVWHLSSRTPEKSTLWTPWFFYKLNRKVVDNLRIEQKGSAIFFTRLYKPRNRDVWGDTLMAMLLESFLSYHT